MTICRENSLGTKTDHLKYRVNLVQAFLVEHWSGTGTKVPGTHSTDRTLPQLTERYFS
jgi:hypothetical protein